MPAGNTVRPRRWSDVIDLYDDGDYSAIWGYYNDFSKRYLGVRWNGSDTDVGYPNYGAYPTWYVEPHCLTRMILLDFYHKVNKNPGVGNIDNILTALKECE